MIYPWQDKQWQHLLQSYKQGTLPHALLFCGMEGLGKLELAKNFAALLLCENKNAEKICCECSGCRLLKADTHPDFTFVQPETSGKAIKIDQIRALSSYLSKTPQRGGYKIAIIAPADAMNIAAANALLKTLEEPEGLTLLILVSARPQSLPATVRSRCQKVNFTPPDLASARTWLTSQFKLNRQEELVDLDALLTIAAGSPLKVLQDGNAALELREKLLHDLSKLRNAEQDPLSLAADYENQDIKAFCQLLAESLMQMITRRFTADKNPAEPMLAARMDPSRMFAYLDKLLKVNNALNTGISLNKRLLLEELLFGFVEL